MTELFEPSEAEKKRQETEQAEDEGPGNLAVSLFFFLAFAGALYAASRWLVGDLGLGRYGMFLAASYTPRGVRRFLRRS